MQAHCRKTLTGRISAALPASSGMVQTRVLVFAGLGSEITYVMKVKDVTGTFLQLHCRKTYLPLERSLVVSPGLLLSSSSLPPTSNGTVTDNPRFRPGEERTSCLNF